MTATTTSRSTHPTDARHRGGWALAVVAVALAALAMTSLARPAGAAELAPVLTDSSFTHQRDDDGDGELDPVTEADPLSQYQGFRLGIEFTLAPPLAAGDTFEVGLPDAIRGSVHPAFALLGPGGEEIGTCSVDAEAFRCELTNPVVATWETADPFTLQFSATAWEATTETTLPFEVSGGGTYDLPGPPGGIGVGGGNPYPEQPRKSGWTSTDHPGEIQWVVNLPRTDATTISFTDTLGAGEGQDLVPESIAVFWTTAWNPDDVWDENTARYPDDEVDLTVAGDRQSFSVSFASRPDGDAYWVQYRTTVPSDVEWGDRFSNRVLGEQFTLDHTVTYTSTAGGTGGGNPLPDLRIRKVAVNEPEPATYSFTVSCVHDGVTTEHTARAAAGGDGVIRDLPIGAVCTIVEDDPLGADVTFSPGATITITDDEDHVVDVTATNTFAVAETTTTTTSTTTPSTTPTTGPTTSTTSTTDGAGAIPDDHRRGGGGPSGSDGRPLSRTGAAVGGLALVGALLLAGGLVLVDLRRRDLRRG